MGVVGAGRRDPPPLPPPYCFPQASLGNGRLLSHGADPTESSLPWGFWLMMPGGTLLLLGMPLVTAVC